MSILSDKETEIVRGLRYPIFRSGSRTCESLILQRKGEHRMNVEITKNENMEERLAAYAEKTAK